MTQCLGETLPGAYLCDGHTAAWRSSPLRAKQMRMVAAGYPQSALNRCLVDFILRAEAEERGVGRWKAQENDTSGG